MVHSPKAEGDGFQNKEEAGCAGTRWLSLPSTWSTTALSLEEARSPHPLGASVLRSAPQRQGEKRPSSALFQRGSGCGTLPCSWGASAGGPGSSLFGSTQRMIVLDKLSPTPRLQAPSGGLKALTTTFPCALVGPSLAQSPILSPVPGAGTQEEVCHPRKKPSGLFQLCRDF